MSLRELGRQITYDYSHLSRIESGKSVPSAGVAEKVDDLFGAEGYLTRLASAERAALELHSRNSEERDDVDRRSFLGAATGVAASAGLDGLENVRRVLADGHMRGPEEWESIVRDYGHLYHVAAPSVMLPAISADLALLGKQINTWGFSAPAPGTPRPQYGVRAMRRQRSVPALPYDRTSVRLDGPSAREFGRPGRGSSLVADSSPDGRRVRLETGSGVGSRARRDARTL